MSESITSAAAEARCNCLVLRQAARQVTQLYDTELADAGLRVTQYSVLAVLARLRSATVNVLADELVMDRSTLGHNLRPLERQGLVRLSTDKNDRRSRSLELTKAGQARLEAARPHWRRAQALFESRYGKADAKELRGALRTLVDHLTALREDAE